MPQAIKEFSQFARFCETCFTDTDEDSRPEQLSATQARVISLLATRRDLTARDVMKSLRLDAGYLSRILKQFERKKFLTQHPSPRDGRARLLRLTERGHELAAEVNASIEARMGSLLGTLAPESIAPVLSAMHSLLRHMSPTTTQAAPLLFRQLTLGDAGWIIHRHGAMIAPEFGWDERFEAMVAHIMADFIRNYDPAFERSWVVERAGAILGSLLLVREDATTARLRLLYVEPATRGMGLATKLLEKSIRFAREKGYQRVQLFTTANNHAAIRIYQRMGFMLVREEPCVDFGEKLVGQIWEFRLV